MTAIKICAKCSKSERQCAGVCRCTVDGVDIIEHARLANCSLGFHVDATADDTPASAIYDPVPLDKWPLWTSAIAKLKEPIDVGVGDTVHRKLGAAGKLFKAMMEALGVPCGCDDRRAEWNQRYPYGTA